MTDGGSPVRLTRREALKRLGLLSGAVFLAASSGEALATPGRALAAAPARVSGEPVSLDLLSWFWYEPGRQTAWRDMIQKFHSEQSDVRINEAGAPFEDFNNRLVVQATAGSIEADLVTLTPELAPRLIKGGLLEPIEDVAQGLGILDKIRPGVKDWLSQDGHLYGFDTVTAAFGLGYISTLYEAAGITRPPTTIDEFVDAATRLTRRPDQFGFWISHRVADAPDWWFRFQLFVVPWDGKWAEGKTPLVTSEPVTNAVKLLKTLYDVAIPQGTDVTTYSKLLAAAKVAQTLDVSPVGNVLKANSPETFALFRSAPVPWPSQKSLARVHPISVVASSGKKDAAKAFLAWLYKPENYAELTIKCLDLIPMYPLDDVPAFKEYQASQEWAQGYVAMTNTYFSPTDNLGEFIGVSNEFGQIVVKAVEPVLTENKRVEDQMAIAQKQLEALAERI